MIRALLIPVLLLTLAACETIKGAGRDIETAGEAIQSQARETEATM